MMKPQNREEVHTVRTCELCYDVIIKLCYYMIMYIAHLSNRTKYIRTLLCKKTDWNWSHKHEN